MAANVGAADRILRIVIGALLIAAPYLTSWAVWGNPIARWLIPIVGVVLIVTAIVRFCPLYRVLGVDTCKAV